MSNSHSMNPSLSAGEERPERANFATRALARLLDLIWVIFWVLVFSPAIQMAALRIAGQRDNPSDLTESFIPSIGDIGYLFLLFFLALVSYHTICTWLDGATLGKFVVGVKVQMAHGRSRSFLAAFIRSVAVLVDGLLLGLVADFFISRSPEKQRLGDRWAGTVVVKGRDFRLVGIVRFILVWLIAQAAAFVSGFLLTLFQVLAGLPPGRTLSG